MKERKKKDKNKIKSAKADRVASATTTLEANRPDRVAYCTTTK